MCAQDDSLDEADNAGNDDDDDVAVRAMTPSLSLRKVVPLRSILLCMLSFLCRLLLSMLSCVWWFLLSMLFFCYVYFFVYYTNMKRPYKLPYDFLFFLDLCP